MQRDQIKGQRANEKNDLKDESEGSLIPLPSLNTWRTTSKIVELLLEGRITWDQIKFNYQGQEPDQKEIELYCNLSPVQKRVLSHICLK